MVSEHYESVDRELQMTYSAFDYMADDRIQRKDESRKKEAINLQSIVADFKQQFLDQLTMFRRDLVEMIREERNIIRSQSGPYIENPMKSGGSSLLNIASGGSTSSDEEAVYTPESNYDSIKVTTTTGVEEEAIFLQASNVSRESMVTVEATVHEGEEIEEESMEDNEEGDSIDYCESDSNQNGSEIQSHMISPIVYPQSPTTIPPTLESNTSIVGLGHNKFRASPTSAFSSIIEWNKSCQERVERGMRIPECNNWIWVPMELRKGGEITKAQVEYSFMTQAQPVILNWPKPDLVILYWPKPTSNLTCTFTLPTYFNLSTSDGRDGWSDDQRKLPPPPVPPPLPPPLLPPPSSPPWPLAPTPSVVTRLTPYPPGTSSNHWLEKDRRTSRWFNTGPLVKETEEKSRNSVEENQVVDRFLKEKCQEVEHCRDKNPKMRASFNFIVGVLGTVLDSKIIKLEGLSSWLGVVNWEILLKSIMDTVAIKAHRGYIQQHQSGYSGGPISTLSMVFFSALIQSSNPYATMFTGFAAILKNGGERMLNCKGLILMPIGRRAMVIEQQRFLYCFYPP